MLEHQFQCPYCWENITMLLDSSVSSQTYIEDCEVCCNPIEVSVEFSEEVIRSFRVNSI